VNQTARVPMKNNFLFLMKKMSTDFNALYPSANTEISAAIEISKKDLEIVDLQKKLEDRDQRMRNLNKELLDWRDTMMAMMKMIMNKL
jgi:predicted RNase H-like nuclease (RuvC/YqgF family)